MRRYLAPHFSNKGSERRRDHGNMTISTADRCPTCGATLPPDASGDHCPRCLFRLALDGEGGTCPFDDTALSGSRGFPGPGVQFGRYRILQPLGKGGMGAVFEAEDADDGRRLALKMLSHALDSPEARERFFREGRLAASINHPNSVYVFGTEEIAGTPVIAMELVAGGTLQDRVEGKGPLSAADATDAILQVIAGLEAAQRIGILHRDIKPSNCFMDGSGRVKIGDFGLSLCVAMRTGSHLTIDGSYLGTPGFSAPEQLRGDVLDVRSDIYSVGVTLYYLLTGKMPFEGQGVVQLLAAILERKAASPALHRQGLPSRLCRVVLRCLEKDPDARFKDYGELRAALLPHASTAQVPPAPGLRFLAGVADFGAWQLIASVLGLFALVLLGTEVATPQGSSSSGLSFLWHSALVDPNFEFEFSSLHLELVSPEIRGLMYLGSAVLLIFYYAIPEGLYGASFGKWLCGLRVTGPGRNVPGMGRAAARACLFIVLPSLPIWVTFLCDPRQFSDPEIGYGTFATALAYYAVLALLFCTMRQRNGLAAAHDLLTKTRVIRKPAHHERSLPMADEDAPEHLETRPLVGPYHVLGTLERSGDCDWLLGYDTRLMRRVWLQIVPQGTPAVGEWHREIDRIGRLRWITGRRSREENWDAYQGIGGQPLLDLIKTPRPWGDVRHWLLDLANEIMAAERDGTLPSALGLDRVWIGDDGRARLLDFKAPGAHGAVAAAAPKEFLEVVARACLGGGKDLRVPMPLHARRFMEGLGGWPSVQSIAAALEPLLRQGETVTRARRAALIAGCVVLPFLMTVLGLFFDRVSERYRREQPEIADLSHLLAQRMVARASILSGNRRALDDRSLGVYVAAHYRPVITNDSLWRGYYASTCITAENRTFCEQSLQTHKDATAAEIADATALVRPLIPTPERRAEDERLRRSSWFPLAVGVTIHYVVVAIPAILAALLFKGGLVMLACSVAVVRADGLPASRSLTFWRSIVGWSPFLLLPFAWIILVKNGGDVTVCGYALALLVTTVAGVSIMMPGRGLQDRIAGTCLVPR